MKRSKNSNVKTASARNCSHYIGRFRHRRVPVDMKSMLGETRKSVHCFTRRGDVTNIKFPTKQANRNLKGALHKNVHIISAEFFIGRSAMPTRTGGASPPGPPLFLILHPLTRYLRYCPAGCVAASWIQPFLVIPILMPYKTAAATAYALPSFIATAYALLAAL